MSEPITITATVAAWLPDWHNPNELIEAVSKGHAVRVVNTVQLYGKHDMREFGKYVRVGEADVTLRLIPHDEQVAMAVTQLRKRLDEERTAWLARQQEIMDEISKLQALPMADVVEA